MYPSCSCLQTSLQRSSNGCTKLALSLHSRTQYCHVHCPLTQRLATLVALPAAQLTMAMLQQQISSSTAVAALLAQRGSSARSMCQWMLSCGLHRRRERLLMHLSGTGRLRSLWLLKASVSHISSSSAYSCLPCVLLS
jgi:hypothetical protein